MSAARITTRFTKADSPCPVCGEHTKGCSATEDGLYFCRGEARDGWQCVKQGEEFHSYRREEDDRHRRNGHANPKAVFGKASQWPKLAREFAAKFTGKCRDELAEHLGLPLAALDGLPNIGLNTDTFGPHWTFAEVNAEGVPIGICRRYAEPVQFDGELKNKLMMKGSKHGLYIAAGWDTRPGPVLCPEGVSDLLALFLCGVSIVGRPSAQGGVELLTQLSHTFPADRDIIIIGENDQKPDGKHPGREGAESTAKKLADALCRPVKWSMVPESHKDSREWVRALLAKGAVPGSVELWQDIVGYLYAHAVTIGHSADTADSARGWPAPVSLSQTPDTPTFPVDALPGWLAAFVQAQATELQVPADLPALLALGAVAGGISRKVTVTPWPGWNNEPTNIFVMPTLPPGERKSQTFNKVFAPISDLERDLQEAAKPLVSEAESEIRVAQKRIEHLEQKIAKLD